MKTIDYLLAVGVVAAALGFHGVARAQTGVSADRVSLPGAPGGLEGVGDNVGVNSNMALMTYSVPIDVPGGFPGATPSLALQYTSGAGNSTVGMGFSLDFPSVERMTARGVPHYTAADLFVVNGSDELVELPGSNPPTYRSRYESGFVRYTWMNRGTGADGYWKAEYPDGRVGYFGADATGTPVPSARLSGAHGTFRYYLVESVDVHGHAVRYSYNAFSGNIPLVEKIGYAHEGSTPRFSVEIAYELRPDKLSDAKPGFEALLQYRVSSVTVYSRTTLIQRHTLTYEDDLVSGGLSRLIEVEEEGMNGQVNPIKFTFAYTQTLGGSCDAGPCQQPYLTVMGSLGAGIASRDATLLDINGDALPDIIDTSETGPHKIYLSKMTADGAHTFAAAVPSAVGNQSGHRFSNVLVQELDLDGDGFSDVVNHRTGQVLRNLGSGDWASTYNLTDMDPANLESNFDNEDLNQGTVRFLDFDNDRRIDILQAATDHT